MAFEIARVHGLISSRAGDEGGFNALCNEGLAVGDNPAYSQTYRPLGAQPHPHSSADLSYYFRGNDQRWDGSGWPLESLSSCSTETESDEEDDLFQGLAQQVAHSMLGEEQTSDHVGFLRDNWHSEGQLSPSSWSSGSWSSRSLLTGSRSSSKGSSRVSSHVSSPSSAPSSGYQDAWETLYAAAGEVVRLKMNEGKKDSRSSPSKHLNSGVRNRVPQHTRQSGQTGGRTLLPYSPRKAENPMAINQAERIWAMRREATIVPDNHGQSCRIQCFQHEQVCCPNGQPGVNICTRPAKMIDSKTLQRTRRPVVNGGCNMRVVFLGANTRRESGTGVFLPRVFDQKKPLSTRQNETLSTAPVHGRVSSARRHDEAPREGVWPTLQKSMNRSNLRQPLAHEPCLPIEWTY